MSGKQVLIGAGILLLLVAFFLPNLVPIGESSSTCQGSNCGNMSSSSSYASISVIDQTLHLTSTTGNVSTSFSVADTVPVSLDAVGLDQFSVSISPNFANGSTNGIITISNPSAQALVGTFPFTFEAITAGSEILATVSMSLVYSTTSQNSTVTTTNSSSNSSLYFGLFSSYTVHLTRYLIGQGGSVLSTTPLYSVFGSAPTTSAGFVNYTLSISTVLGQGISPSGRFFVADFQTFGASQISPDATPITLASGNGWNAYDFRFIIPITGESISFLINATSVIDGIYAAANAGVSSASFQSQLSKDLLVSENLSPSLSKQFIDTTLNITTNNNILATIAGTSFTDFFNLPSSITTTSSSVTSTTTSTTPANQVVIEISYIRCFNNGRCSPISGATITARIGNNGNLLGSCVTSGGDCSITVPAGSGSVEVEDPYLLIGQAINVQSVSPITVSLCECAAGLSVVPSALNISPGVSHELSIFGLNTVPGTSEWSLVATYIVAIFGVIVFGIGIALGFKD